MQEEWNEDAVREEIANGIDEERESEGESVRRSELEQRQGGKRGMGMKKGGGRAFKGGWRKRRVQ